MKSVWTWLTQHYQAVSILVGVTTVVVTTVLAVYEYRAENIRKTVERSLDFSYQYRSGILLDAQLELKILFDKQTDKKLKGKLSDEDFNKLITDSLSKGRNSVYYGLLIGFFDAAHKCTEVGACDRDTMNKLLHYDASYLYATYSDKIKKDTETDKEYTQGLLYFVKIPDKEQ